MTRLDPVIWLTLYLEHRRRLFGPDARCARCGTDDVVALLVSRRRLCRRCDLERRTGRTREEHHLGRSLLLGIEVDANDHAWLNLFQYTWKGKLVPGSIEAIVFDLLVLAALPILKRSGGAAA